jgi:Ca2+-binding RTX toxin-like protein
MITNVNSSAGLSAAVAAAHDGDTILLAAGDYGEVRLSGDHFARGVTIASADSGAPAVLTGLKVTGSSGLSFSGLEFQVVAANGSNPFQVSGSHDISFDHLDVHGSLDGNPQNDTSAFLVRSSTDVAVTDSEFQQLANGFSHLDDTGLTIRGNSFHDIRTDSIHGGGSSNVTIDGNSFRDSYPVKGDHPDAIQFWTTNTTGAVHDITITDNVIERGAGKAMQGVFLGNEKHLPYVNVNIAGNLVSGGMYHGVFVKDAQSVHISDNIISGYTDMKSWIFLGDVKGATLDCNLANQFVRRGHNADLVENDDATIPLASDSGASAYQRWLKDHTDAPAREPGVSLKGASGHDNLAGGSGGDTITDAGGANYLRGAGGDDLITGGSGFDDINGNAGADTAHGRAGDDWVVGGKDNDALFGDDGGDLVYGNLGDDTADGGAADDIVRGGQGDDQVTGGAGNDWLSGDRGGDTLTGGTGADVFHSFGAAGVDRVTDFHAAEGDHVLLDHGSAYTVSQAGADTVVAVTGGATVVLADVSLEALPGGWIVVA